MLHTFVEQRDFYYYLGHMERQRDSGNDSMHNGTQFGRVHFRDKAELEDGIGSSMQNAHVFTITRDNLHFFQCGAHGAAIIIWGL